MKAVMKAWKSVASSAWSSSAVPSSVRSPTGTRVCSGTSNHVRKPVTVST
ncbi:hypothetical protein GS446_25140 [Rhodococcus hoagii]|nr:hypothetical protein [Prescottella equi]